MANNIHPRIGELCRNGKTVYYLCQPGGFVIEFATFDAARCYLMGIRCHG